MPKGPIHKVPVCKKMFMKIVKDCGSSILQLGQNEEIECTERTIRRSLNEGKMTPCYLEQIARYLNVDTRLLSGELHKKEAKFWKNDFIRQIHLSYLTVENYPYFGKRKDDLNKQLSINGLLERILSLYLISFSQFEEMDFESQYELQYEMFSVLIPVIRKHFNVDAYGREDMPELERIIYDLEGYKENHDLHIYAEEVLRPKYLMNPPCGKQREEIERMSIDALIDLDMSLDD